MSVSELSSSTQDYLKAVWALQEWTEEPVTQSRIASRLGLRASSVSDAIRKLTVQGLIEHRPYGAVDLTEQGRVHALEMVRRHRLIETFLVETLGYGWDEVHDEAEQLEHAVSDLMVDRIDALLDFPRRDPHGDPIPSASGQICLPEAKQLDAALIGTRVVLERISDADADILKFLQDRGLVVGAELVIEDGEPMTDLLAVRAMTPSSDGEPIVGRPVQLGPRVAQALFVRAL